jgi:uncharacterized protein
MTQASGILSLLKSPYLIKSREIIPVMTSGPAPDLLDEGISSFNARKYFEAHEAFEDLWRPATGDLRLVYQGIVQACAGLVKHQRGQPVSAITLLRKGLIKLESDVSSCRSGVDVEALARELRCVLDALGEQREFPPPAMKRAVDI